MSAAEMKDLSVLVVDDYEPMRLLLRKMLSDLGVASITTANDGLEALRLVDTQRPNLIITDHGMERLDGVHFIWELRTSGDPELKKLPIIMVTAHTEPEILREAEKAGADAILVKPISDAALKERITKLLPKISATFSTPPDS